MAIYKEHIATEHSTDTAVITPANTIKICSQKGQY